MKDRKQLVRENTALRRRLRHLQLIQKGLELKLARLDELYQISEKAGKRYDITEIMKITMQSLMGNFGIMQAAAFSIDTLHRRVEPLTNISYSSEEIDAITSAVTNSRFLPLLRKPIAVQERFWKSLKSDSLAALCQLRVSVFAPLPIEKNFLGFIVLGRRLTNERFTRLDVGFVSLITTVIAMILKNLRIVDRHFEEQAEKYRIRGLFEQFVAPQVVEKLISENAFIDLDGKRQRVTVLMADIRNFTPRAKQVQPETLVRALNDFYSAMSDIVFKYDGMIDKFIGDAVLAIFGTPIQHDDDSLRAVQVGLEMVKTFHDLLKKDGDFQKVFSKVGLGVGVCTGDVIIGGLGSGKRIDYTAIGAPVNLAARISSIAQAKEVLIDEETYHSVIDNFKIDSLQPVAIKGFEENVTLYKVTA